MFKMSKKVDYDKHMLAVSYVEAVLRNDEETQEMLIEELDYKSMTESLADLLLLSLTTYSISHGDVPGNGEEHRETLQRILRSMRGSFVERC